METYNLSKDEFDLMAQKLQEKFLSVKDDNFVEQYLMRYKDFTGELETEAQDVSSQIESDAQIIADELEQDVQKEADKIAEQVVEQLSEEQKAIMGILSKFGL